MKKILSKLKQKLFFYAPKIILWFKNFGWEPVIPSKFTMKGDRLKPNNWLSNKTNLPTANHDYPSYIMSSTKRKDKMFFPELTIVLNGDYSKIKFLIGKLSDKNNETATLIVFFDGQKQCLFPLNQMVISEEKTLFVSNVKEIKFVLKSTVPVSYELANLFVK